MKKNRVKKGYMIAAAALALMAVGLRIPSVYASNQIDTSKQCSLTLEVPDTGALANDLAETEIQIELYRIASVEKAGVFHATTGFEKIDFKNQTPKERDWEQMAKDASAFAESRDADTGITIEKGTGKADNLQSGVYLVLAEPARTDRYEYSFSPYLISLPDNLYYHAESEGSDTWVYDAAASLKPERTPRYGNLKIQKTLKSYNTALAETTFVFDIEAVDADGVNVYSNVVSTTHSAAGIETALVEHIPAGAVVTVTEVYSGASYQLVSNPEQTVTIQADDIVTADFTNTYQDKLIPGYGVTNQFNYSEDEGWQWSQADNNSTAGE